MALPSIVRVRLDLRKIKEYHYPSLIWLSIDTSLIHTIQDLKKLIIKRLNVLADDVNLFCQDCYLPSDETIAIVRDEDLLRVYCKDQHTSVQENCDSYSNCLTLPVEKECKVSHKKRKRNSCDDTIDIYSDSRKVEKKTEMAKMYNSINSEDTREQKQSRKKKKHVKRELEHSESKLSDSSPINNDSSSENIKKKRKKHSKNVEPRAIETSSDVVIPMNTELEKNCTDSLLVDLGSTATLLSEDKPNDNVVITSKVFQHEGIDKSPGNNCRKKRKRSRKRKNKINDNFSENIPDFEKSNKESVNKEYLETSNKSNIEQKLCLPLNKHVKFEDSVEGNSSSKISFKETSSNQNSSSQAHSFSSNGLSFITSSPLEFKVPKNGIVSTIPKKENNENPTNSRIDCTNLVATIQNKYKEFTKERQLASINTNISTIYTNKPSASETFNGEKKKPNIIAEKKDYKKFSILKGPPRIGDIIAYKILELSADYCPQMSDYKEGKVICYNDETDDIEVELTTANILETKKGKFDLPNIGDGHNPIQRSEGKNTVIVNWAAMVEPRLIS